MDLQRRRIHRFSQNILILLSLLISLLNQSWEMKAIQAGRRLSSSEHFGFCLNHHSMKNWGQYASILNPPYLATKCFSVVTQLRLDQAWAVGFAPKSIVWLLAAGPCWQAGAIEDESWIPVHHSHSQSWISTRVEDQTSKMYTRMI